MRVLVQTTIAVVVSAGIFLLSPMFFPFALIGIAGIFSIPYVYAVLRSGPD